MYSTTTEDVDGSNDDLIPQNPVDNSFGYAHLQLGGEEMDLGQPSPYSVVFSNSPTKEKKRKDRLLLFFCLLLAIIAAVFIGLYVARGRNNRATIEGEYCVTPGCIDAASFMQNAMDHTVDPCKDFYQFSCGGWMKKHPIPDKKTRWGVDSALGKRNIYTLRQLLEKQSQNPQVVSADSKAVNFYKACMDDKKRQRLAGKPLLSLLKQFDEAVLKANQSKSSQIGKYLEIFNKNFSISALFSTYVEVDARNSSKYAIQVSQGGLTLSQTRYTGNMSDPVLIAYHKYLTDIHVLLGAKNTNQTKKQMQAIINFETSLAKIFVPRESMTEINKNYHNLTISELQKICPIMDWQKFYKNIFNGVKDIPSSQQVVVLALPFIKKLSALIDKTPTMDLFLYLHWKLFSSFVEYLSDDFRNAQKGLQIALFGTSIDQERWKTCVHQTDNSIGFALGAMFIKEAFSAGSKKQARQMVEELRSAFIKNLPNVAWMDDKTRKAAEEKARAIVPKIGFPKDIIDPKKLNKMYSEVTFSNDDYFGNILNSLSFKVRKSIKLLPQKVNKNSWYMTPSTVNAYYDPTRNQIVFPAGILQPPYYDVRYPGAVNFGGIGAVIGHELLHGFDNDGRLYDKNGNSGKLWWTDYAVKEFRKKTKCFIDEYGKFMIKSKHINGKVTLGENIADNGGLDAAYRAYKIWQSKNTEKLLPAISRSNEQVFFISFAQSWCTSSRMAAALAQLDTDTHSPPKDRVLGSVSNSFEFAKAFKCPLGSTYNPVKKCKIW
eukprot:gene15171-16730_t